MFQKSQSWKREARGANRCAVVDPRGLNQAVAKALKLPCGRLRSACR